MYLSAINAEMKKDQLETHMDGMSYSSIQNSNNNAGLFLISKAQIVMGQKSWERRI